MNIRKQVKQNARRAMTGNWGKAICIFMILIAIFIVFGLLQGMLSLIFDIPDFGDIFFPSYYHPYNETTIPLISVAMSVVFMLLGMFINSPLIFGVKGWYYRIVSGENEDVGEIFSFFSRVKLFFKAIWHDINIGARMCLWSVIFAAIPASVCTAGALVLQNPEYTDLYRLGGVTLLLIGGILTILAQIFLLIFTNRYFLSAYLIAEDNTLTVSKAIKTSVRCTKGSRGALLVLDLSFIPWVLFSFLLFPLLYFVPYYSASNALYAKYLIERDRRNAPSTDDTHGEDFTGCSDDGSQTVRFEPQRGEAYTVTEDKADDRTEESAEENRGEGV